MIDKGVKNLALAKIKSGTPLEDISKSMDIHIAQLKEWDEELVDEKHLVKPLNIAIAEGATALLNNPNTDRTQLGENLTALSLEVAALARQNVLHQESLNCLDTCANIIVKLHKTLSDQNGTTIINQSADGSDTLSMFNSTARH